MKPLNVALDVPDDLIEDAKERQQNHFGAKPMYRARLPRELRLPNPLMLPEFYVVALSRAAIYAKGPVLLRRI